MALKNNNMIAQMIIWAL